MSVCYKQLITRQIIETLAQMAIIYESPCSVQTNKSFRLILKAA